MVDLEGLSSFLFTLKVPVLVGVRALFGEEINWLLEGLEYVVFIGLRDRNGEVCPLTKFFSLNGLRRGVVASPTKI